MLLKGGRVMTEKASLSLIFNHSDAYRKLLNNPFATVKNICYFVCASKKLGAGFRIPCNYHRHSAYFRYGGLLRAVLEAGRSCGYGNANPLWPASISFASNVGGLVKLTAGNTMKILWCLLGGVCHRVSYAFCNRVVHVFFGLKRAVL